MNNLGSGSELFCSQVIKCRYCRWKMLMSTNGKMASQKRPAAAWWEQLISTTESLQSRYRGKNQKQSHRRVLKMLLSHFQTIQSHSDKGWFWVAAPQKSNQLFFFLGLWVNGDIFYVCVLLWEVMLLAAALLSRNTIQVFPKRLGSWIWSMIPSTDAWLDLSTGGNKACGISTVVTLWNHQTASTTTTTTTCFGCCIFKKKKGCRNERSKLNFSLDK